MIAFLIGVILAGSPTLPAAVTGTYELDLPTGRIGLEVTLEKETYGAIFRRPDAPEAHAQSVKVEGETAEIVLLAHGAELRFHLTVTGDHVTGRYTVDGGSAVEFTGRRVQPPPGG